MVGFGLCACTKRRWGLSYDFPTRPKRVWRVGFGLCTCTKSVWRPGPRIPLSARSVRGEWALVSAPARRVCGDLGLDFPARPKRTWRVGFGLCTCTKRRWRFRPRTRMSTTWVMSPEAAGSRFLHKRIFFVSHRNVLRVALNHPSQVGYASLSYLFPHPELGSRLRP